MTLTIILVSVVVPLALGGLAWVSGVRVAKVIKPSDWSVDNASLREDMDSMGKDLFALRQKVIEMESTHARETNIWTAGFGALSRGYQRLVDHWGETTMPVMDSVDQRAIEATQALAAK